MCCVIASSKVSSVPTSIPNYVISIDTKASVWSMLPRVWTCAWKYICSYEYERPLTQKYVRAK
jgi:hypothetical protein